VRINYLDIIGQPVYTKLCIYSSTWCRFDTYFKSQGPR